MMVMSKVGLVHGVVGEWELGLSSSGLLSGSFQDARRHFEYYGAH